jgi:hypothetical protein
MARTEPRPDHALRHEGSLDAWVAEERLHGVRCASGDRPSPDVRSDGALDVGQSRRIDSLDQRTERCYCFVPEGTPALVSNRIGSRQTAYLLAGSGPVAPDEEMFSVRQRDEHLRILRDDFEPVPAQLQIRVDVGA